MRILMLDKPALDPELQAMLEKWEADGGDPNFVRLFGRLPDTLKRFIAFYSPLVRKGLVEHRTKELVRLRLAQLNDCHYWMTVRYASGRRQGITEELVAALPNYEAGPFSEREKAALRYADQMYFDHHKVDDALWAGLRAHFSEDEALEVSWAIAEFIALGKMIKVFDLPFGAEAGGAACCRSWERPTHPDDLIGGRKDMTQSQLDPAQTLLTQRYHWSEAVLLAVCQHFGIRDEAVPRIATAFGGGIGGTGSVCGALVGGVMAIGLRAGRQDASERDGRAYRLTQELRRRFETAMGHIECRALTGMDLTTADGARKFYQSDVLRTVCVPAVGVAYRTVLELLETSWTRGTWSGDA